MTDEEREEQEIQKEHEQRFQWDRQEQHRRQQRFEWEKERQEHDKRERVSEQSRTHRFRYLNLMLQLVTLLVLFLYPLVREHFYLERQIQEVVENSMKGEFNRSNQSLANIEASVSDVKTAVNRIRPSV